MYTRTRTVSLDAGSAPALAEVWPSGSCDVSGMTVPGTYVFHFQLSDPTHSVSGDRQITVDPANAHAPTISSATGQALPDGRGHLAAVTSDADGDGISHWWMLESSPAGSTVTFYDQGQPGTDVWADVAGTYKFRLVAVDRTLYAESGQVSLSLQAAAKPVDGDINADGGVDVVDLLYFVDSFGKMWGEEGFDRHCDLNGDGGVDVVDLLTLVENWPQG